MLTTATILVPFLLGGFQVVKAAPKQVIQLSPQEGLEIVCNAGRSTTVTVTRTVEVARTVSVMVTTGTPQASVGVVRSSSGLRVVSSSSRTGTVPSSTAGSVVGGGGGNGTGFRNAVYFTNW